MTIQISKKAWGHNKLTPDGRVEYDAKAAEKKLDVSKRLQRKSSKKVRVARKGQR